MVAFNKRDLEGVFVLLAVLILFDSILGHFIVGGIVTFIILLVLVWLCRSEHAALVQGMIGAWPAELVLRVAVGLVFLGVLTYIYWLISLGFFIGAALMFSNSGSFTLDILGGLKLSTSQTKTTSRKKKK